MAAYTTIDNPELYFQTKIYTGDGNSGRALTLPGDTDMSPDLVWVKDYGVTRNQQFANSVSGANKVLLTDLPDPEDAVGGPIRGFGSDGFTINDSANVNADGATYISWSWLESATAGFDIVTYTGNGTDDTDISHSLSAVPHLMIVKNRSDSDAWRIYHHKNTSAPETDYLVLDTAAVTTDDDTAWSDEAPTSSVFTVGASDQTNESTDSMIAFLFSEKQGFSKFGAYNGNGDADGPFIYTGFRPAFLIIKRTETEGSWNVMDIKRDPHNPQTLNVKADVNSAGETFSICDILSNGFKIITTNGAVNNGSGNYVYIAFADQPFVNSNGVPCNAR